VELKSDIGFRRKKKRDFMHRERCFHKKLEGAVMHRNEIQHIGLRRKNNKFYALRKDVSIRK
jgi:hypothetical protein